MISFKIQERKLIVDEKTLVVPQFNALWELYKDKQDSIRMLTYVYGMADITTLNPYVDTPHYDKEATIKKALFKDPEYRFNKKEQKLLDEAIEWYKELNKDSVWRLLETINMKIDQINDYLRNSNVDAKNLETQVKTINNISSLLKTKAITEEAVQKQVEKQKAKGDMGRSPLETGQVGYNFAGTDGD